MLCDGVFSVQFGRGKAQREALVNTIMGPWVLGKVGNFSACQEWFYNMELVMSTFITVTPAV
jgi:hypothetical protein